jgi:uncharacterized protein YndB with AHSA1/START domain
MSTATQSGRKMTISKPSEREIRTERIVDASRDRVWRAFTDPTLIAQWWGRGHKLVIERFELHRGGHWRFVEHGPEGESGFEGRFREVTPQERIVQSFEWDGMPAYVTIETLVFEDLGDGRTRLVNVMQFHTPEERDGFLQSGFEGGMNDSYAALDRLLATLG